MDRQEFINRLRTALSGRIPPELVEDNVSYYQDYIAMEIRKGRTEEEVLAALGDPRLIARTIVQTSGQAKEDGGVYEEPDRRSERAEEQRSGLYRAVRLPGWITPILVVLIGIAAVFLFLSVLSFLLPFLLVFAAAVFMIRLFHWLK